MSIAQVVIYPTCPNCGSRRCPCRSTQGAAQYRKCAKCNHTFKTVKPTAFTRRVNDSATPSK